MNSAWRRLATLGVAALVTAGGLLVVAPALASPATVDIESPTGETPVTGPFVVSGVARHDGGIEHIRVLILPAEQQDVEPQGRERPGEDRTTVEVEVTDFAVPPLNGLYRARFAVTGDHTAPPLGPGDHEDVTDRLFRVEARPAPPEDFKASMDRATFKVSLTWAANNEGDLLGYVVERARAVQGGTGTFVCIAVVSPAASPKHVDDLSDNQAGDYRYRVIAVRKAAPADEAPTCSDREAGVRSTPSPVSEKFTRPASTSTTGGPSTTTATTRPSGGTGGSGGTAGGTRPPSGRPPNLNDFTLGAARNLPSSRPGPQAEVDTGFSEDLGFARPGEDDPGDALVDQPPLAQSTLEQAEDAETNWLLTVAAILLVLVLLAHVLWIKREVDRLPLEPLAPEDVPA